MILRLLIVVVVLGTAVPVHAGSVLAEQWMRVQQALAAGDSEQVNDRLHELEMMADERDARRLTPYASALVLWAGDHPDDLGATALAAASRLDAELPSSYFLAARWRWQRADYLGSVKDYLRGWRAVFVFEPARRILLSSTGGWLLLVLGWTLTIAIVLQVLRYLRQMAHDAVELSLLMFSRANALVLAAVILLLPIFVGLGPLWLAVYLFVLSWVYMGVGQRITALVSCAALALLVPALVAWQDAVLQTASLTERLRGMFEERQIDPVTLREFSNLEEDLDGLATYHMLLGEMVRMHGDPDLARLQFQKAALADARDPAPLIFLGNLSMEDGDIPRAVQQYNAAIELDARSALAYHNLSSAYDQSRMFEEGDAARDTAREIAGRSTETLGIRGMDPRIRYPRLGSKQVTRLLGEVPTDVRLETGKGVDLVAVLRQLMAPTSRVFWILAAVGVLIVILRSRWMWTAQTCTKCGKVFCPKCKTATESASYCSQCISVFLKRDVVSIEQQTAKQSQIRRWLRWSSFGRRLAGFVVPGSYHVVDERIWLGLVIGFFAWLSLSGALLWAPMILPSVEPLATTLPIQIIFGIGFAVLWLRSAAVAWYRR